MGHIGPAPLYKLGKQALGVRLNGPTTVQCEACAMAKIKRQVSRRPPDRAIGAPGQEIHIDWTDLSQAHNGYVRVIFITDRFSGLITPYFMSTHGQERENLRVLKDYIIWLKKQHDMTVQTVRSDNELFTIATRQWLRDEGISAEPSAPNTQAQNGLAERSGGVILEKARAMRGSLPNDLWPEIINTAAYLYNRTPRDRHEYHDWRTPYELFYKTGLHTRKKPQLAHLKAYGSRAYAMTPDAQLKRNRLKKLDPRAYIGYLVGYDSTNIYRVWVPQIKKVIATRDVIFNEYQDYAKGRDPQVEEIEALLTQIELPQQQSENEKLLEEDEEIFESNLEIPEDDDTEHLVTLTEDTADHVQAFEEALMTPPPSENSVYDFAGYVRHNDDDEYTNLSNRLEDFRHTQIESAFHGAFEAGRKFKAHKKDLPPPPETARGLQNHKYSAQFKEAQRVHLESHSQMGSFKETHQKHAKGQPILGCMWVFTYKTDKHGFLQKCKARLVVWGNQQAHSDLPTRATTLASTAFRALMGVTAKFDLETRQVDAVNAFVHCPLDEVVYMKMPPGFEKQNTVLRLQKALYGLRRSPLLWQTALTKTFSEIGFKIVPQEPCVMIKNGLIVFFYVDDIVFCYQKKDKQEADQAIETLRKKYSISDLGDLKWFLGVHILRDRMKKSLWLSQKAYVEKIATQFGVDLLAKPPSTPMAEAELLPNKYEASRQSIRTYQQKTGSLLFATITTRPDCAFAVSRLARFNQNPGQEHHEAVDRVI